jgi:HAMP domain-containing protein
MILLFNGLLLAWVLLKPGGDRVSAIVLNAAGFVGPLLVLPLCFGGLLEWMRRRGASRTDEQPSAMRGQRLAPVLLGMGILCYILGQMGFTYYDLVLRQAPPFPSLADVGYLIEYPFFLLGILLLPARPIPVASRARIALDGLMIMTAALTFSWYFVLGPVVQQGTETVLAKVVSAAYPLADIVLIACLVILALRPGEHALRPAAYVLALALGFYVVMDSIYAYQVLNGTYVTGTLFDVGWPVAYMLIGLGAFAVRLAPEAASPDETPPARQGVWRSLLPYALVPAVGVLAVYAWRASAGSGSLAAGVYLGGAVLICLVLLRQILTIVENARLYNRLQRMYVQIEHYLRNVERVTTAAAAVEAGEFDPKTIEQVAAREDELGQLARVFQRMAGEVQAREQRLKQEVQQLRIEIDETRTARQVAEITETDYFRDLQRKADRLRSRSDVDP